MSNLKYKTTYQTELPLKASDNSYAKNINQKQINNTHYENRKNENSDKRDHKNDKYTGTENKKQKTS
jgi:hypothetical protein